MCYDWDVTDRSGSVTVLVCCWELSAEADRCCQSESDVQTVRFDKAYQWLVYMLMSKQAQPAIGGSWKGPPTRRRTEPHLLVENVSELSINCATYCTAYDTKGRENLQCITMLLLPWQEWWSMRKICFLARVIKEVVPNFVQSGFKLRSWAQITIWAHLSFFLKDQGIGRGSERLIYRSNDLCSKILQRDGWHYVKAD